MVGQQSQGSLRIFPLKGVDTYGSDGKPDIAMDNSIFFPSLYLVNPVGSDRLPLNQDRVGHDDLLSLLREERKTSHESITEVSWAA